MNGPRKDRSRARCKARPPTFWKRSRHRVSGGETGQRSTLIQRLSTGHTARNALAAKNPDADPDPDLPPCSRSRSTIISERPSREECAIKMDQNVPAPFVSCVIRPDPLARRTLTNLLDDILSSATVFSLRQERVFSPCLLSQCDCVLCRAARVRTRLTAHVPRRCLIRKPMHAKVSFHMSPGLSKARHAEQDVAASA